MQTITGNLQIIGNKIELINNNCGKLKFYKKNFKINEIIEEEEDDTTEDDDEDDDKDSRAIIDDLKNYGINNKLKKIREAVSIREIVGFLSGQGYRGRLPPLLPSLTHHHHQQQEQEQAASLHPLQIIATKSSHIYQEHFGKYYQQLNDVIINGKLMSSPLLSSSSSSLE